MNHRFVFIGAGNLATRLSTRFQEKGFSIEQVYSRTEDSAKALADRLQTAYTTSPEDIISDADIYFVALKDSAFQEVLPKLDIQNKLLVHCSGSMPLSSLEAYSENIGVIYPLQTFSKKREVNFSEIPVFVEANSPENEKKLLQVAGAISEKATVLDSENRMYLHLSAVFACNFVNHFYTIAGELLKSKNISFDVLHPLILETSQKVQAMEPAFAQTGPAVRFDKNVIAKHLNVLREFPEFGNLYEIVSESIFKFHQNK
ncbi:NADP oxidoreductase coenzyme F420-dependent [Mariniphaga anaerophila]|uniref:NADP oxidoreductase coenzyme F420-dependent n=1 Tax=Mariniphaga anaerophila TaxID=1484053 RepID=A0A1M5G124_9BACT|nr:DUF2520 domain-containing protein [Mariniphaga anaerophila]SHF97423.1 NADP oxidoreductase coenzyme F420-dependent [Mariniphaga anaerophila]